jgi:hypothetical protein
MNCPVPSFFADPEPSSHNSGDGPHWWATLAACAAVVCIAGFLPTTAAAFQRTETCGTYGSPACQGDDKACPLYWNVRDLTYRIKEAPSLAFPADSSADSSTPFPDELKTLIDESFDTWQSPSDCSNLDFQFDGYTTKNAEVNQGGIDNNQNVVIWQESGWTGQPDVLALTFTSFQSDGRVVDADMVVNAQDFQFEDLDQARPNGGVADVQNTLVHEVGHFIGLAHSSDTAATMYRSATVGEIKKRTLHPDDIAGLCTAYPDDGSVNNCASNDSSDQNGACGGCSNARNEQTPPIGHLLVLIFTLTTVGLLRRAPWSRAS